MNWRAATMRILHAAIIVLSIFREYAHASELKIATWNLEHLNDTNNEGCVPRVDEDYKAIREQIEKHGFDIVAFQEVENKGAARRVFPPRNWRIVMSKRSRAERNTHRCITHLSTGFAIRKGIRFKENEPLDDLANGNPYLRWGTDIAISAGKSSIRLLSIHLKSGCWGAKQDGRLKRKSSCDKLRAQISPLKEWAVAREREYQAFAILGDFNRQLNAAGDWAWAKLSTFPDTNEPFLRTLTSRTERNCHKRRPLVDHIVVNGKAASMLEPEPVAKEVRHEGEHPDHCALFASFKPSEP